MKTRRAYTLAELLVVIGIITLIILIAIPSFNLIAGNRSIDGGQNQLQAIIGRARQEAMGLQDYRGVILFTDPNTGRVAAAEVFYPTPGNATLGIAPSHDEVLLPKGIGALSVQNQGTFGGVTVLMFDGQGQFTSRPWQLFSGAATQNNTQTAPTDPTQRLSWRIQPVPTSSDNSHLPTPAGGSSDFGFVLFPDPDAFSTALQTSNGQVVLPSPGPPPVGGTEAGKYVADKGASFLVNRYNGTLLRTE